MSTWQGRVQGWPHGPWCAIHAAKVLQVSLNSSGGTRQELHCSLLSSISRYYGNSRIDRISGLENELWAETPKKPRYLLEPAHALVSCGNAVLEDPHCVPGERSGQEAAEAEHTSRKEEP